MNTQCIVTTTIQKPQPALFKLLSFKEWDIILAGDTKTPDEDYRRLEKEHSNFKYISVQEQDGMDSTLSALIGWRCIQRRNMALLYAYRKKQYKVIGTFDDDNIIYDSWDGTTLVGKDVNINEFTTSLPALDPFKVIGLDYHHRGYPLTYINQRDKEDAIFNGKKLINVGIEVPIPEGDPDIDAITRIMKAPDLSVKQVHKELTLPFTSDKIMPFNSQCTFVRADLIPYYMMLVDVGRHDDILGAYLLQKMTGAKVVFSKPIAKQIRNEHDLTVDMSKEIFGYCNSAKFIEASDPFTIVSDKCKAAFERYNMCMKKEIV